MVVVVPSVVGAVVVPEAELKSTISASPSFKGLIFFTYRFKAPLVEVVVVVTVHTLQEAQSVQSGPP